MSSTVTRNREGVPGWEREPSSWGEYKEAATLYVASTRLELRYTNRPRLAAELTGAARTTIQGQRSTWLCSQNGAEILLKRLEKNIAEPALPEVGNLMRQYFRVRRKKGESITAFCVRHREKYDRMCRALGRMVREQGESEKKQKGKAAIESGAPSHAGSLMGVTSECKGVGAPVKLRARRRRRNRMALWMVLGIAVLVRRMVAATSGLVQQRLEGRGMEPS